MPLAFPPAFIERAAEASVTNFTRRVSIFEADNTTMWQGAVPFLASGEVTIDMSTKTRRSCGLDLYNFNGNIDIDRNNGLWYDKVFRVYMGIKAEFGDWETSIGTFIPDRIKSDDISQMISVTLRDFAAKLDYEIPYALEWPTNEPVENIIQDLASGGGVGPAQTNLPLTGANTSAVHTLNSGTNRWTAMQDLAIAHGYDLFFDVDGILQMEVYTDPAVSAPQFQFRTGTGSNVASIGRQISPDLIRNHIVVTGEQADGVPVWGEAENNEPTSPTRIAQLGRRTRHVESAFVTSNTQCVELAERYLKVQSLERYESTLGTVILPWMDVNETVEFVDPQAATGDPTRYLLNRVTIPLDLSAASARLARVTNVI